MLACETIEILLTLQVAYRSLSKLKLCTETITLPQVLLKNGEPCSVIPTVTELKRHNCQVYIASCE